jgi:hypothetical protein
VHRARAVPANHVSQLIAAGQLETSEALCWRGRLRDDPIALPWVTRYEIDLTEEAAGAKRAVKGGPSRESLQRARRGAVNCCSWLTRPL